MRTASGVRLRRGSGTSLAFVAVLLIAGCIPVRPSPSPSATEPASTTAAPSPTAAATASADSSTPTGANGVAVDPSLLGVLPASIAGVPVRPDLQTAADITREGSIATFVSALALATVFGPAATDGQTDYVVVTVAKLRPGTFSDAFFRGWRDTFDDAVCQVAGGVTAKAESDIAGRHTYIGTCRGGVHTYHVHLATRDLIVSMQGAGPGGWPEQIVQLLTE